MLTIEKTGLRYLSSFAALALALGVAACNEEGDDADQTGAVPEEQMAPEDPAAMPAEPAEPAPIEEPETTQ
jgi:hypothetical protein